MILSGIYQLSNYISNKEKSGNAFTPKQFNSLIEILNREFFKSKVEESGYFESRADHIEHLQSSKLMRELRVNETIAASGSASYTFAYFLGATDNDTSYKIELVSEDEYHDRVGDSVIAPSSTAPIAMLRGDNIIVKPDSVANVNLSYYRYPSTPFLDYYIATSGIIQWLGAGVTHTWTTTEIDSSGTAHTTGDADWSSLTVELEFNSDLHDDFQNEVLSRVGIRLKEPQITQYAESMKAQQKQM